MQSRTQCQVSLLTIAVLAVPNMHNPQVRPGRLETVCLHFQAPCLLLLLLNTSLRLLSLALCPARSAISLVLLLCLPRRLLLLPVEVHCP